MEIEHERRFRLTSETYLKMQSLADWSPPAVVTDVTMGLHGRLSMATDGWIVRLRTTNGRSIMQYKGRLDTDRRHLEAAVGVDSLENAAELLSLLGLRLGLVINRTRRYAQLNGAQLALDDVSCLGQFLEVEVQEAQDRDIVDFLAEHIDMSAECGTYGDQILDRQHADSTWDHRYREESRRILENLRLQHLESGRTSWRNHG